MSPTGSSLDAPRVGSRMNVGYPAIAVEVRDGHVEASGTRRSVATTMRLGPWRLVRELGVGGMGTVWLAERADGAFHMTVAVKLINHDAVTPEQIGRFVRERQILADLEHANICRLIDGGTADDGRPYLVMERVDGRRLDHYHRDTRPSIPQLLGLFVTLCGALSFAHARGIIHRDLKPSNIMVSASDEPKLLDFGIARMLGPTDRTLTQTGELAFTPMYASPEQWKHAAIGPTSDIFSLAVVLLELLTGSLPPVPGLHGVPEQHLAHAGLDPRVAAVMRQALRQRPEDRYPDMDAFADALRGCRDDGDEAPLAPLSAVTNARERVEVEPTAAFPELPGGIVHRDSPYYLVRSSLEDACLTEVVKPGALIRIRGSRQMGKTSLLVRLLSRAAQTGARTVSLNLQLTDNAILDDLDRFLRWLCAVVSRRLAVPTHDLDHEWDVLFGAKDNCTAFFENHILSRVDALVLAIDHVDRVFEHPNTAEEFLSVLRAWNEMAKSERLWSKLRLVLVYATEMYLPMNVNRSPFNVGLPVGLSEWSIEMVGELALRYGLSLADEQLARVMDVLSGHPHLIRTALHHLANGMMLDDMLDRAADDDGPFADHLKSLLWYLRAQPELGDAAKTVMAAATPVRLGTEPAFKLASLGLVRLVGNDVQPARELYRRYFTERL